MRGWRSDRARWGAPPNQLTLAIARARASGATLLDLTVSNPTQTGTWHDPDELREILASSTDARYYPEGVGLRETREVLATHLSSDGDQVSPEDLVLCASTSEAYSWILKTAVNAGDSVLTHTPGYPLIPALAELEQVRVLEFPLLPDAGKWSPSFPALQDTVAGARLLSVVNPNNPTGNYLSGPPGTAILAIAEEHGIPVISDEVFIDFAMDGSPRSSLAAGSDGLVFALGGLSKALALPHWKLAWMRLGGDSARRAEARESLEWIADSYLSVSIPVQIALPRLLATREKVQRRIMERLRRNLSLVTAALDPLAGVEVWRPEGGWSVIVRMPAVVTDEELSLSLIERENVLVQPGYFFDLPWAASFVLSLISDPSLMEEGLARLSREIERLLGA